MKTSLQKSVAELPSTPGVYFYYNATGEIIYIGKASNLKRRVSSYFTSTHNDYKTPLLVKNIASLKTIDATSEIEALFLEAEYIKRHKPLYNVEQKDDKNYIFIRIDLAQDFPSVTLVRRPSDDKARYFGPFVGGYGVRQALKYLRKVFPFYSKTSKTISSKLEYQIGVAPRPDISKSEYRSNIRKLILIFEGKSLYVQKQLEKEMRRAAKQKNYELAATMRNQYLAMKAMSTKIVFGKEELLDVTLDAALEGLRSTLGLAKIPNRIECYDISNFAGTDAVSSMIVFTKGLPDQAEYRHFKMRTKGPNDFAMMQETLTRRFGPKNAAWPKPDLIIIDGGKGQLSAAQKALDETGQGVLAVGLAKRYETIIVAKRAGENNELVYESHNFADSSPLLHLVQRIRDEAHRFAVSYHIVLRKKRTKSSVLDSIEGVGPKTKKVLLKSFGSVKGVGLASQKELADIVGPKKAKVIFGQLH